jgi:hypothetical protein
LVCYKRNGECFLRGTNNISRSWILKPTCSHQLYSCRLSWKVLRNSKFDSRIRSIFTLYFMFIAANIVCCRAMYPPLVQ